MSKDLRKLKRMLRRGRRIAAKHHRLALINLGLMSKNPDSIGLYVTAHNRARLHLDNQMRFQELADVAERIIKQCMIKTG